MRKLLKPLSFIPALLLMYMIFTFSSQPGDVSGQLSYKVSCKIVEAGDYIFDANLDDWQVDEWANKINFITRKLAHITEYFLLAIAVSFPLYVYGLHGFLLMLAAGILCVGFAAGDEYHQSFVAGRGPSVKDVGIDSIGIFFGIIIVRIIGWTGRMTIFKEKTDKKEAKRIKKQMEKAKKAGIQNPPPVVNNVVYNKKKRPVKEILSHIQAIIIPRTDMPKIIPVNMDRVIMEDQMPVTATARITMEIIRELTDRITMTATGMDMIPAMEMGMALIMDTALIIMTRAITVLMMALHRPPEKTPAANLQILLQMTGK